MQTSDQLIDGFVQLRGMQCDPRIYREALVGLQRLITAEVCHALTLDMLQAECAISDKYNEQE